MKHWSNGTSKALLDLVSGADSCDGSGKGKLIVFAGRPATGVADILLRVMSHVAVWEHRPVGLFSLEMDSKAVVDRLIRIEAEIDSAVPGGTDLSRLISRPSWRLPLGFTRRRSLSTMNLDVPPMGLRRRFWTISAWSIHRTGPRLAIRSTASSVPTSDRLPKTPGSRS